MRADTRLPPYLPYPRFLLQADLTQTAKLLYALLLDRATLSQANGWLDEGGRIYLVFPIEKIAAALDILERGMAEAGGLSKTACMQAEEALLPLKSAAREYEVIYASHAHIDMNWMWGWQETVAVALSTFRTMLNLMKGVHGYTLCSGIICEDFNGGDYVAVPFNDPVIGGDKAMKIGYIQKKNSILSKTAQLYIRELRDYLGIPAPESEKK